MIAEPRDAYGTGKVFYAEQSDLTATKISVYEQYLRNYLPKILMQFGSCFIADFFCGCGKNGEKDGSPLVLLNVIQKTLENPVLKKRYPDLKVVVWFSDVVQAHCDDLKSRLPVLQNVKIVGPHCCDFKQSKQKVVEDLRGKNIPKFFFLDPFTYSSVGIDEIKELMAMPIAEVLLFLPTFHTYRFHSNAEAVGALKIFLENFTDKGCADYEGIHDLNESIRRRLLQESSADYARLFCLDGGSKKNALFFLTKHICGMLLMNNLAWKLASDGVVVKSKSNRDDSPSLFDIPKMSMNFQQKRKELESFIREKKRLSNVEIIDFVARQCFATNYASDILKDMRKNDLVDVEYMKSDKTRGFYVSDDNWNNIFATIVYRGE
jgi:three-Cys-motif partner protein